MAARVSEGKVIEDCYVISSLRKFRRKLRSLVGASGVRGMNAPLTVTACATHSPRNGCQRKCGFAPNGSLPGLGAGYLLQLGTGCIELACDHPALVVPGNTSSAHDHPPQILRIASDSPHLPGVADAIASSKYVVIYHLNPTAPPLA